MRRAVALFVLALGIAAAAGLSSALMAQVHTAQALSHRRIAIDGCVVAGEKNGTYILKNLVVENAERGGLPNTNVFYRLSTTKGLKNNVGRVVQVVGIVDFADLDKGEVSMETTDAGETIVTMKSERQRVKAKVNRDDSPAVMVGTSGTAVVPSYKLTVESVKRLADRCPS